MLDGNTALTEKIIGCAIEVPRVLGPGLPEAVCETALCIEMQLRGIPFKRQVGVPVYYKGELISEYHPDLIIANEVIVEVKSVERIAEVHVAQVRTYLRITSLHVGLIMNFNSATMRAGVKRVVLNA
ncbi:MAG TPA: GxxExxY protein [Vicinamibacterales bacterium]